MKLPRVVNRGDSAGREGLRLARVALAGHVDAQPAGHADEWIYLGFGGARCRVTLDQGDLEASLPLWYQVEVRGAPEPIQIGIAGLGDTIADRARQASHDFATGVVAVLRRCFLPAREGDGVDKGTMTTVTADGAPLAWDVFVGPPQIFGYGIEPEVAQQIEGAVTGFVPFGKVLDGVVGVLADQRLHWVKLFLVSFQDGKNVGEAAVDNVPSAMAFDRLRSLDLPQGPHMIGFRQFIAIAPSTRPVTPGEAERVRKLHGQ